MPVTLILITILIVLGLLDLFGRCRKCREFDRMHGGEDPPIHLPRFGRKT